MAIDLNAINGTTTTTTSTKKQGVLGQQEFLTLLVNQLQNQDPLDPMDSQDFAAQLATFSQLEQSIAMNENLAALVALQNNNPISQMAPMLGREIVVRNGAFDVTNGKASHLLVDIPEGTQGVRVDIVGPDGTVYMTKEIEEFKPGKSFIGFDDVDLGASNGLPDGSYLAIVTGVDAGGGYFDISAKYTNTVQGFVLEPTAALVINGKNVDPSDIIEVY